MNEQVRVEAGEHGTIVVVGAWCPRCDQDAMPDRDGACMFCGDQIVDLDTLNAKELLERLKSPAPVIPLRQPAEAPPPPVLRIADGFTLPIDVAGEATAILAKRGAGKTNTARVLAEEYARHGVQLAVLDPVGVWWGARSAAGGQEDGLPLPVFGGDHADADLHTWAGAAIADAIVDSGLSLILDLSEFGRDDQRTFAADFAEQLYARKSRQPSLIHVILEEADEFAPQRARGSGDPEETARMRAAVEQLARRGRSRGIGLTMVTQRSAALSKDVLTQADVLIAMRTTGPTDIRAVEEWVRRNADGGDEVVRSLPTLQTGEGWVWNPERDLLARIHVRLAWTFDSSSTPRFGEQRAHPARRATVELPLPFLELAPPALDIAADHRLQDAEGRWGCKTPGCDGRSESRAGPLAFLCPTCAGHGQAEDGAEPEPREQADEVAIAAVDELARREGREPPSVRELARTLEADETAVRQVRARRPEPAPPIVVDGEEIFGLTGYFDRDAQRVRDEADRLRAQADALDRMAESLDELAALQVAP